jgi:hypothetical protein
MGNDLSFEAFVDDPRGYLTQSERARTTGRFAGGRNSRAPGRLLDLGHNTDTSSILNRPKEGQTIPICKRRKLCALMWLQGLGRLGRQP